MAWWLSRKQLQELSSASTSARALWRVDSDRWQRSSMVLKHRGDRCTLLVFIDDATSKLMQLRFVPSESTDSYFEALQG